MSNGSQQYHLIIFIYPSALFLALFKLPVFKMQNLIFGRCLIFQPSFQRADLLQSVPVERVCRWVLLSLHLIGWCRGRDGAVPPPPRSALVVYGDVDGVAFGCWASEGLRCSDRRMGPSCPSRGCTFLHPKARAGGEASTCTQRQITLLPGEVIFQLSLCFLRFHFCSYRLVLPCKENNT